MNQRIAAWVVAGALVLTPVVFAGSPKEKNAPDPQTVAAKTEELLVPILPITLSEIFARAAADAKITTGGKLKAKYVIHTVGPVYRDGAHGEPVKLASAYRRSLEVAGENGVTSIAFPSISTGAYRYPITDAARVALRTVVETLPAHPRIRLVRFVLFSAADLQTYEHALAELARR